MWLLVSAVREEQRWQQVKQELQCEVEARRPTPPMAAWRCSDGSLHWRDETLGR